jgi:hypothetical protein
MGKIDIYISSVLHVWVESLVSGALLGREILYNTVIEYGKKTM